MPWCVAAACDQESWSDMHSYDEILEQIRATLVQMFELEREDIQPQSRLFEDLEIDSIDVVDLMDEVRRYTGKKVTADDFRSVRTIHDLITVVERLMRS